MGKVGLGFGWREGNAGLGDVSREVLPTSDDDAASCPDVGSQFDRSEVCSTRGIPKCEMLK